MRTLRPKLLSGSRGCCSDQSIQNLKAQGVSEGHRLLPTCGQPGLAAFQTDDATLKRHFQVLELYGQELKPRPIIAANRKSPKRTALAMNARASI